MPVTPFARRRLLPASAQQLGLLQRNGPAGSRSAFYCIASALSVHLGALAQHQQRPAGNARWHLHTLNAWRSSVLVGESPEQS